MSLGHTHAVCATDVGFCFSSPLMCFRSSRPASFQRATCRSSPPTFWTGSPASRHTSWLSSPLCNCHCWDPSYQQTFSPMSLRKPEEYNIFPTPGHNGECVGCTLSINTFCFFSPPAPSVFFSSFVSPVWYICPSQKNSGMEQTRMSLTWPFLCCISIYWSFILSFGDALKKKEKKIRMFAE